MKFSIPFHPLPKLLKSEDHVKDLLKRWWDYVNGWHYAPIQTAMGVHGIHDRLGGVPITITPDMVGHTLCVLVSTEAKKPGRRGQKNRGMSTGQHDNWRDINAAHGFAACIDGLDDIKALHLRIFKEELKIG